MKKIIFLLGLLLTACAPREQVAETRVDEELFGASAVSVDALPFAVDLPADWSVEEEAQLYRLVFDDGASGYIQVKKEPVSGALGCRDEGDKKFCTVRVGETMYSMVLTDKGMSATRRAEAEAILESVRE